MIRRLVRFASFLAPAMLPVYDFVSRFFGHVVESGFHSRSIRLVRSGEIDASAIDSHVLALAAREDPSLKDDLRVIDVLGPSTVQPVVAADWLPEDLRDGLRRTLLGMA